MIIEGIDISNILKARDVFEKFRANTLTEQDKAGAVQAFEFCYELAWKTMKRVLANRGVETGSPKDIFRKAALEKLIDDPERWFAFQRIRNLTTHTYDANNLEAVVASFPQFAAELNIFIKKLMALK